MTIIYFILILGVIIFIHELGHFLFAKKAGVKIFEFAIGMGPKVFSKKSKKSETEYSIRLIPLGGFCSMAGESNEDEQNVPKDKLLQNKTWFQRFMVIFAGPLFNFILAFVLLLSIGLIYGATPTKPIIGAIVKNSAADKAGLEIGDTILSINNKRVNNWDQVMMQLQMIDGSKEVSFVIEDDNDKEKTINIKPEKIVEDDVVTYRFGIGTGSKRERGILPSLSYASSKLMSLTQSMGSTLAGLFTGKISVSNVSGPVGIYNVIGEQAKAGFDSILYLTAFLSINVGFINLIPFPAFDGGRILFLIIEKIKGKPVDSKVENMFHYVGFFLLIGLMILVTFNDILRLF
ncbi:MAG: RIP metalloprotease RseP [Firmicutes bacterium]|nr:RIP metalloprotease RseP [Bacillota bacterium]